MCNQPRYNIKPTLLNRISPKQWAAARTLLTPPPAANEMTHHTAAFWSMFAACTIRSNIYKLFAATL